MSTQQNNFYKAALYLRLSKDDENEGESSSISTQRNILKDYAKSHGIVIVDEYVDDGYSGTNYDRPAFKRMIADIEAERVNCVITKDLSRLGRNSSRTADILDEYFPTHNVRYISVIDGYDSLTLTNGNILATPFMLLMNEMYARDISNKIRSSFQTKMENGEYVGSFAPYGYKKDNENGNKNHLVIDYKVSHIVKEMFQMAADGINPKKIAEHFNTKGISTPAVYRCSTRPYLNVSDISKRQEWTSSMVCKMLRNEVYLGKTVQGKTTKVSFKSKVTQPKKREDWIVVDGTHEPLITEEVFRMVRNRSISRRSLPTKGFKNIFSGIAKCADCGRNMTTAPTRKKGSTYNLTCGGYKTYGAKECGNHFIDYDVLYNIVIDELRFWFQLSEDSKQAIIKELEEAENKKLLQNNSHNSKNTVLQMETRVQELKELIGKIYEDYAFNKITETAYEMLSAKYEEEYKSLEISITEIKKHEKTETSQSDLYRQFFTLLNEITEINSLSVDILRKFIDRIEIGQGYYETDENGIKKKHQKIKIYYRFIGCIGDENKKPYISS